MSENTEPAEETVEEPQDEGLGDAGKKALERERSARKEAEKQLKETRDKLAAIERERVRAEVATAKGLTDKQAELIDGEDRETMEAKADELLQAFAKPDGSDDKPKPRLNDDTPSDAQGPDMDKVAADVMRSW